MSLKPFRQFFLFIISLFFNSICFAETDLTGIDVPSSILKVNSGFNSFAKEIRKSIPDAIAGQNTTACSYIGNFLPEGHHFTAGINFSITPVDSSELSSTFDTMSSLFKVIGHEIKADLPSLIPLPTLTFGGRIGGFYIPLDLGFSFTVISGDAFSINPENPSSFKNISSFINFNRGDFDGKFTFFSFGLNARYAFIYDKEKLPDISAGLGWYISKAGLNMAAKDVNENGTLEVNMAHSFFTQVISAESQVSKKFGIFTPFAGCRFLWIFSENGWARDVYLDGVYMPMSGNNCLKRSFSDFYIEPQLFLGAGITAGPVQFALNGSFDTLNLKVSGGLSVIYKK